jgi:hypothetical protein
MPDSETRKPSKSHTKVVERLEKLTLRYGQLVLKKVDTHAKVLLQDELLVALGSFNWLSFRGDPDRPFRDEQSVLITLPITIEQKYQDLLQLFSGSSFLWRRSRKEYLSSEPGRTAPQCVESSNMVGTTSQNREPVQMTI